MRAIIPGAMFVHLHCHSYFSFLDAVPSPTQLAAAAEARGMPALALTDHNGLTGAVEFYEACRARGVRPILGLEIDLRAGEAAGPVILLAEDLAGWGALCRLSSLLQTEVGRDPSRGLEFDRFARHTSGLICLAGGRLGLLSGLLARGASGGARRLAGQLADLFPSRLYIALELHSPEDRPLVDRLAALAAGLDLPLAAVNDVHFLSASQRPLHRLLTAVRKSVTLHTLPDGDLAPPGAFFASSEEMARRFPDHPAALAATLEIADRCRVELPLGVPHYPALELPEGTTEHGLLCELAERGAGSIYGNLTPEIKARLAHELAVIASRGYSPLFLIMADILDFARRAGVPTASRGSAASSLVAHCLGITTPDPLEHNLYFERFLNPARHSPPDIDTDLCSVRRETVIRYVYERYGRDRVAMVATINRLRGRSSLREVAKAHGLSPEQIAPLTRDLPYRGWGPMGEDDDLPYGDLAARFPRYRPMLEDAAALLDFPRHLSIHPGGIVVAPGPLTDLLPLHLASKGLVITQFDLEAVQKLGLVKIDLLGTRGLSVLGDVAEWVRSTAPADFAEPLDVLAAIRQDDGPTSALVAAAETIGCFQIESPGMRATLREVQARTPQDLLIALALYRPGPMTGGLKDAFIRRHLGLEPVQHLHPALAPLLADTHGVVLYQEQVLRIASELAGLSLADADLLRRAMSHFDPGDRMRTLKARFLAGAGARSGVPAEAAEQIWELMAAFAGYGFPKAHAASYAQVAWQSAWCKAHFPAEFIAAVLANWGGYYRQRVYLNEARRMGLSLKPPHINFADHEFRVVRATGEPELFMGLNQVRELSRRSIRRILEGRPFVSLEDFLARVDPRRQEAENLVRIGALEGLGEIRALLARLQEGGWQHGQRFLFDLGGQPAGEPWTLRERVAAQEQVLGVGLEAHPLELLDPAQIAAAGPEASAEALLRTGSRVRVLGMRQTVQRFFHEGEPRHVLELEDLSGVIRVVFSPARYREFRDVLRSKRPLLVTGTIRIDPLWQEPVLEASSAAEFGV